MSDQAFRARLAGVCGDLAGAGNSDPWGGGHDAWKVGGKMFACIGAKAPGVAVKCADVETAAMLIEADVGERAPYFHKSWIRLPETTPDDELAHRVRASYALVRSGLTKKAQAALTAAEAPE